MLARCHLRRTMVGACLVPLLVGCAAGSEVAMPTPGPPVLLEVAELGLQFRTPAPAPDVVYVMGQAPEGQPAAFFSTTTLSTLGGPSCAAGATGAVSPYPLGRVVLAQETPVEVALETAVNPEESLGEPIGRVAAGHLYYAPPPEESCAPDVPAAAALQARQVAAVRAALDAATAAG